MGQRIMHRTVPNELARLGAGRASLADFFCIVCSPFTQVPILIGWECVCARAASGVARHPSGVVKMCPKLWTLSDQGERRKSFVKHRCSDACGIGDCLRATDVRVPSDRVA